ncbi:MAG: hypothetical protein K0M74_00910 [Sphingopyxis sp.]|nr:hypothetical protein [Sphingopyxis sp.]
MARAATPTPKFAITGTVLFMSSPPLHSVDFGVSRDFQTISRSTIRLFGAASDVSGIHPDRTAKKILICDLNVFNRILSD